MRERDVAPDLAARDAVLEDGDRAPGVAPVDLEHAGAAVVGARAQLLEHQPDQHRLLLDRRQVLPHQVAQPVPRAGDDPEVLVEVGQELAVPALDDRDQQRALVLEVAVHAALDDPGALGDLGDRRGGVALLVEHRARGRHDVGDPALARQPRVRRLGHPASGSATASDAGVIGTSIGSSSRICASALPCGSKRSDAIPPPPSASLAHEVPAREPGPLVAAHLAVHEVGEELLHAVRGELRAQHGHELGRAREDADARGVALVAAAAAREPAQRDGARGRPGRRHAPRSGHPRAARLERQPRCRTPARARQ